MTPAEWWAQLCCDDAVPQFEPVPIAERCWRCDRAKMHDGCAAGLCETCCRELKRASAA